MTQKFPIGPSHISCDSSDSRPKARLINRTTIIGLNKLSNELGPFKWRNLNVSYTWTNRSPDFVLRFSGYLEAISKLTAHSKPALTYRAAINRIDLRFQNWGRGSILARQVFDCGPHDSTNYFRKKNINRSKNIFHSMSDATKYFGDWETCDASQSP